MHTAPQRSYVVSHLILSHVTTYYLRTVATGLLLAATGTQWLPSPQILVIIKATPLFGPRLVRRTIARRHFRNIVDAAEAAANNDNPPSFANTYTRMLSEKSVPNSGTSMTMAPLLNGGSVACAPASAEGPPLRASLVRLMVNVVNMLTTRVCTNSFCPRSDDNLHPNNTRLSLLPVAHRITGVTVLHPCCLQT